MNQDIRTMLTKQLNQKEGRKGYMFWKWYTKNSFSPIQYGSYLLNHKKKKSTGGKNK